MHYFFFQGSFIDSPDSLIVAEIIKRKNVTLGTKLVNSYKGRMHVMHVSYIFDIYLCMKIGSLLPTFFHATFGISYGFTFYSESRFQVVNAHESFIFDNSDAFPLASFTCHLKLRYTIFNFNKLSNTYYTTSL